MGEGQSRDEEYQIEIKEIDSTYKIKDNPFRSRSLRRTGSGESNQVILYTVDKTDPSKLVTVKIQPFDQNIEPENKFKMLQEAKVMSLLKG